jgi:hypothetical protein
VSLSLSTLEEVRRFGDLLELEAGPPLRDGNLAELQSLGLWRSNRQLSTVLEERAEPWQNEQRRRQEERRMEAARAAELERRQKRRQEEEEETRRLWDDIFAIGLPLKP